MHPAAIEFIIKMTESVIPIGTGMVMNHIKAQANQKILESKLHNLTQEQKILAKHKNGGIIGQQFLPDNIHLVPGVTHTHIDPGFRFLPNLPQPIIATPIERSTVKLESDGAPFIKVPNTGDINQMHAQKWNEYWKMLYDLPDNASKGESIKVMNKIEGDIKKYKCVTCRENSIAHLKEMKQDNDLFSRVTSKQDAIQKLCRFKNKINDMKGEELFACEKLA